MKKLTKTEKAAYPQFIAYIDLTARAQREGAPGIFIKAMQDITLLDAIRRMEKVIQDRGNEIYLAEIITKTDLETEWGEPLYTSALMTRVNYNDLDEIKSSRWHFRDEAHGEHEDGYYVWYGGKDRKGVLEHYEMTTPA